MTTPDPSIKIDRSTGRSSEQSICQGQKNGIKTKVGQTGPIEEIKTFVPRVTGRTVAVVAKMSCGQSEAGSLQNITTDKRKHPGRLGLQQPGRQQAAVQTINEIWPTTTVSQKKQTMAPQEETSNRKVGLKMLHIEFELSLS